jgi:hypothetical protein
VAQKRVPIKVCDRCGYGKERPATQTRKFSLDDDHYKIDLCDPHAEMFDRDLGVWSRLGRDDESYQPTARVFTQDAIERERRAAEVRAKSQPELFSPDAGDAQIATAMKLVRNSAHADALRWRLTPHAHERAAEREVTVAEVIECAAHPDHVVSSDRGDHSMVHHKGDVRVCVDPKDKVVITVYPRIDSVHDNPNHRYDKQAVNAR